MKVLDGIKAISAIVRQYNDLELNQQIIDLTQQALDLVNENARLTAENEELRKTKDIESDIEYYVDAFVTRKSDDKPIKYCAACWVDKKKLVPLQDKEWENYDCPLCKTRVIDMRTWEHRKEEEQHV